MTPEITALTLAALLQMGHLAFGATLANLEIGTGKTLSPRDGQRLQDQLSTRLARLFRAFDNHTENLILFAIGAVVITLTDQSTSVTVAAAWIYLAARIAYIPAYAFGLVPWRSLIWAAGWFATLTLLIAALI